MVRDVGTGRLRVTPRPHDRVEESLAAADDVGRVAAADRVAELLSGFRADLLDASADDATMALIEVNGPSLAAMDLMASIDRDLLTADLAPARFKVASGVGARSATDAGVVTAPRHTSDHYSVEPFEAVRCVTRGSTLVVNNVAARALGPLRDFTDDLSRVTNTRVQVNAYISERSAEGFGRHWDDHDVLILQVRGRKQWDVFAPVVLSPMLGYADGKQFGAPVFSTVLEPGMGLYIPRGWGHEVRGFADELSVHLTCGMRRLSGMDLLRGVVENAEGPPASIATTSSSFSALGLKAEAIEAVYGRWRSRSRHLPQVGPLQVWTGLRRRFEDWSVRAPAVGGLVFVDSEEIDAVTEIGLAVEDHTFALDREAAVVYAELLRGDELGVDRVMQALPGADPHTTAVWLMELGARGAIELSPPATGVG